MIVDWTAQWREHAPNFAEGQAHIDLGLYGPPACLRMLPGAGFGDSSHPTTRLVLHLLASHIHKKTTLIDIGCGSGILSLAALLWGAQFAIGVDIDQDAIQHAQNNCSLNNLSNAFFGQTLPHSLPSALFVVMNMISSEQRNAWRAHSSSIPIHTPIISSGVLVSERSSYLEEVSRTRGWELIEEAQEEEWIAFRFTRSDCSLA